MTFHVMHPWHAAAKMFVYMDASNFFLCYVINEKPLMRTKSKRSKVRKGLCGPVGLFVNKLASAPRVEGSHAGSSSFFRRGTPVS